MVDFRRGSAAIEKANKENQSGGNSSFRPFAPQIFWAKEGDEGDTRYLLFLNPIEEIPTVDMITFIPQTRKRSDGTTYKTFEQVIARTDPAIGEDSDPMADNWDGRVRPISIAAAVELIPDEEEVKGRKRVTGFKVKTREFERKVRDEDGEATDEVEVVTTPDVGFVTQSPTNFFNIIASYDAADAPIDETPVRIKRIGRDKNTTYQISGFPDQDIDLSELVDNAEFIGYFSNLDEAETEGLLSDIDSAETDLDAARIIGAYLLDRRLAELSDREVYDGIYKTITETLDPWSKSKPAAKKKAPAAKKSRPAARKSSRKTESEEEVPEKTSEPDVPEEDSDDPVEEEAPKKPRRSSRSSSSGSDTQSKLEALRAKAREAANK